MQLPYGWDLRPLSTLGTWSGGGTPSKANAAFWVGGSIPWLSPKDMQSPTLSGTQDHITVAALTGSAVRPIAADSIAVVVRSGILEHSLPVAIVPFATTLNQDMKAVTPNHFVDPRWIAWGLRAHEREILQSCRKAGTTVASIDTKRLLGFKLPVPPIEVQRRIVAVLEDHLSHLDAADAGMQLLARRAKLLQASALAGAWRSAETDGSYELLGDLGTVVTGSTPATRSGEVFGSDVPFATPSDIGGGRLIVNVSRGLSSFGARDARLLPPSTVLAVCIGATLGKIGWTDRVLATNQQVNALTPLSGLASAEFVAAMMTSPLFQTRMRANASSTTMPILNKSRFKRLGIPVPQLEVQQLLLQRLSAWRESIDRLAGAEIASRPRSQALRRALLQAAFSGRLTSRTSGGELEGLASAI